MKPQIGIVGWIEDEQVAHVAEIIEHLGGEVVVLDLRWGAEFAFARWDREGIWLRDGRSAAELGAVYVNFTPLSLSAPDGFVVEGEEFTHWCAVYGERWRLYAFSRGLEHALADRGVPVVNPPTCFWLHDAKGHAVRVLRDAGLPAPRTLVTACPEAVLDFAARVGELVYKPAGGGGSCFRLEKEDVDAGRLKLLRNAPCLFQEFVEGDNIRIFVLDGEVISCCGILADAVDYRGSEVAMGPVDVPDEVQAQAIVAARAFGMLFTGIDVRRTAQGRYVFLDVNPSPMFIGFERSTRHPIGERLVRFLLQQARRRR